MKNKIKAYIIIGLFCLSQSILFAQNQKLADSLYAEYSSDLYEGDKLILLKDIAQNETNPDKAYEYGNLLLEESSKDSLLDLMHSAYLIKGNALRIKGDNMKALENYFQSLEIARLRNDKEGIGTLFIAIADNYSVMDNPRNAEEYYLKGIELLGEINDSVKLATAHLNLGDEYFNIKEYDKALENFEESGKIFDKLDYPSGTAYNFGNVGMVYAEQGKDELAEKNIDTAISMLEDLEDYYPISVYLNYMSAIYARKNEMQTAFDYAQRSLDLAENYGLKEQISEASFQLSELFKKNQEFDEAYKYYVNFITYRDSLNNIETVQEMARLRTEHEVSQKQIELDLLEQQRKTQKAVLTAIAIALFLIIILALGLFRRNKFISKTKAIIEKEKNRSEKLLLNILPKDTAMELRDSGKVVAKKFDSVSVLFADFVGFTRYSERLSPEEVVDSVDFYFSKFDEIVEKYGLEKIKTLGDCYMCASGLPFPLKDHAQRILLAAFEMAEFVKASKAKSEIEYKEMNFDIKIGINSGPVVAGVVGTKKFAYDIWGDTVNIASRMESHSEAGMINISEKTCELIDDDFDCEYRGEFEVKNKGLMKMYFVKKAKENILRKYSIKSLSNEKVEPEYNSKI